MPDIEGKNLEQKGLQEVETELSPEAIDAIMAKVKDINSDGTAFTGLAIQSESIWKDGKYESAKQGYIRINGEEIEANDENTRKINRQALLSALDKGLLGRDYYGRAEKQKKEERIT